MNKIWTIAFTTLREMILEKIFYVVLFIAALLIGLSFLLSALSFDEGQKILIDFGFVGIQVSTMVISLFAGSFLLAKEIEKQTCLLMLSRPITRSQFLLGKALGLLILNTLLIIVLGLVLYLLGHIYDFTGQSLNFLRVLISLWLESSILLALVIGAALFVRPILALLFGISTFLLGHWLNDLKFFAEKSKDAGFINAVKIFDAITPNFYRFDWKSLYFLQKGISNAEVAWMLVHGLAWTVLLLVFATELFKRKDII